MPNVRNEHDAVAHSDPEERDESDQRRDRNHASGEMRPDRASDQREREIAHDDRGIPP